MTTQHIISRHFDVRPHNTFVLYSVCGDVHLNAWDSSDVKIDAVVDLPSPGDVPRALKDEISFEEIKRNDSVCVWARVNGPCNNTHSKKENSFIPEVNVTYTLYVPRKLKLGVRCTGDMHIGKYEGELTAEISFGALYADSLTGDFKSITIFPGKGRSSVRFIENGAVYNPGSSLGYGSIDIGYAVELHIDGFDSVEVGSVKSLIAGKRSGVLHIGSAGQVIGKMKGCSIGIDTILSILDLRLDSCAAVIGSTGKQFRLMDIDAGRSAIRYRPGASPGLYFSIMLKVDVAVMPATPAFLHLYSAQAPGFTQYSGQTGNGRGTVYFDLDNCMLDMK